MGPAASSEVKRASLWKDKGHLQRPRRWGQIQAMHLFRRDV